MNIITLQGSIYACMINTPQPERLQLPKYCGEMYLLYTHSLDPFSND